MRKRVNGNRKTPRSISLNIETALLTRFQKLTRKYRRKSNSSDRKLIIQSIHWRRQWSNGQLDSAVVVVNSKATLNIHANSNKRKPQSISLVSMTDRPDDGTEWCFVSFRVMLIRKLTILDKIQYDKIPFKHKESQESTHWRHSLALICICIFLWRRCEAEAEQRGMRKQNKQKKFFKLPRFIITVD